MLRVKTGDVKMEDLIEALQIFLKYGNPEYPLHCGHDILYIDHVKPKNVSREDKSRLEELGFFTEGSSEIDGNGFYSYRFGCN